MLKFITGFWFPLALITILLLAVPGMVLYGLNLYGLDRRVNARLEERYQLSYHILIPWWGGLILLLVPFAILMLYFLKLKRKPLSVPSTFLWKKSIEDLHVNSLLQWLRQNVLLLLQLLVVLGLIYGIMAFRFHGSTSEGKHYIIMIDNSASMSATDVAPNRLDWAKKEALKEIDANTDSDVGMVIVFNSSAEIRQSYTSNRGLLREAVNKVEPTQRPTRIEEALSLAESQANPTRSTDDNASRPAAEEPGKQRTYVSTEGVPAEVHLFSDGRFPDVPDFALGNLNLHYHAAGQLVAEANAGGKESDEPVLRPGPDSADNVGIVAINAVRDDNDPTKLQVFVRAVNFRSEEARAAVQLEILENAQLRNIYELPIVVPARRVVADPESSKEQPRMIDTPGDRGVTFALSDVDDHRNVVLHAKLKNHRDRFPLDDEAWLAIGVTRRARVLIVGKPNDILDKFFGTAEVGEIAQVDHLGEEDLTKETYRQPAHNGTYDLVIFDRCAPLEEGELPRSNTFFIGLPPPPWKRAQLETIENPSIVGWSGKSPIVQNLVALYTAQVDVAFVMKDLPPRTPVLIEGRKIDKDRNIPVNLLFALPRTSFTDLVLAFPVLTDDGKWNTTWPLQASFPLFLRNVLFTLGNLSDTAGEENIQPGQPKILRTEGNVPRLEVIDPRGEPHPLAHGEHDTRADFTFGATEQVGPYQVRWDGAVQRVFAVNLLDADESNIEPRPAIQIGSEKVATAQERSQPRELWKWFAFLALAFLMVEWYIYNKRIYV